MSSSLPLILFLLWVSSNACIARPLKEHAEKYHFHKELDKVTLLEICESCSCTKTSKEMIIEGTSGTKLSTSLHTDSPSFLATKEKMRHARSMLGPTMHHVEETFITNPRDTTEDIAQMDYAQPHRKLPIHN